jgi:hypothetical protein
VLLLPHEVTTSASAAIDAARFIHVLLGTQLHYPRKPPACFPKMGGSLATPSDFGTAAASAPDFTRSVSARGPRLV